MAYFSGSFWLIFLQLLSNTIICLSYLSIPYLLGNLIDRRERRQHARLLRLFHSFILLCGINQFLQAWNVWHRDYWLEGFALAGIAIASVAIALELKATLPGVVQAMRDRVQQEDWLYQVVRDSPTPVAFLDKNLRYLLHSRAWCLQLGLEEQNLTGKHHYDVFPNISENQKMLHQEILTKGISASREEDAFYLNGKKEYASWKIQPMFGLDGSVQGLVIFCEMITERKEKEQEINNKNEELQVFAYTASHDLRSPIRTIAKFADFLNESYKEILDEEASVALDYIIAASTTIDTLLDALLEWSRVNTKKTQFVVCNLNSILTATIKAMAADIQAKEALIGSQQLPDVIGDPSQLGQVFANLIANSLKFCSSGVPPAMGIRCDEAEDFWLFSISDNGIGFDSEYYGKKIFLPFQRLVRDSDYPGQGMGLAIAAKIVSKHGGKIWAESTPLEGATFCFTLPKIRGVNEPGNECD